MVKQRPQPQHKPPKKLKKAKRLEIEAAAIARGNEIGKWQGHKKKPIEESLKEHLGHWVDNINPLELLAIIGIMPLVKGTLDIHFSKHLLQFKPKPSIVAHISEMAKSRFGKEASDSIEEITQGFVQPANMTDEMFDWLLAFSLSFMLIRYGGQLIGLLSQGLVSVVAFLIGAT